MHKQSIIIADIPAIKREFTFHADRGPASLESQWHRSYFCTVCGRIWAQWKSESAGRFYAIHRSCSEHRAYRSERSGSLLVNVREDLAILPAVLLAREFDLTPDVQLIEEETT